MKTTIYKLKSQRAKEKLRIALVSDLHDNRAEKVLEELKRLSPDIIAIPGDLTSRVDLLDGEPSHDKMGTVSHKNAFWLLFCFCVKGRSFQGVNVSELEFIWKTKLITAPSGS